MAFWGQSLEKSANSNSEKELSMLIAEHRATCRDSAINIDIIVEKVKELCRYYFFMDRDKTDNAKSRIKALISIIKY